MNTRRTMKPPCNGVKARLADFDQAGLIGLIQDLYAASKDNQAFLHARFSLSDDVLKPYKAAIDRWLWPDVFKSQNTSVTNAKKAISLPRFASTYTGPSRRSMCARAIVVILR
jgi:hypothetical protein